MSVLINNSEPARVITLNGSPRRAGFRFGPGEKRKLDEKNRKGETMLEVLKQPGQLSYVRALIASGAFLDPNDVFTDEGEATKAPKDGRPLGAKDTRAKKAAKADPAPASYVLSDLSEAEAIEHIGVETDAAALNEWFALEQRPPVKKAIEARAKKIQS